MKVIFAFNPDTDEFLYHGPTRSAAARINFLEGKMKFPRIFLFYSLFYC